MERTRELKERLEQQEERTRDYSMAITIFSNALLYDEPITEEQLEIIEYVIYTVRGGELCECEDCGCLFTPYED